MSVVCVVMSILSELKGVTDEQNALRNHPWEGYIHHCLRISSETLDYTTDMVFCGVIKNNWDCN